MCDVGNWYGAGSEGGLQVSGSLGSARVMRRACYELIQSTCSYQRPRLCRCITLTVSTPGATDLQNPVGLSGEQRNCFVLAFPPQSRLFHAAAPALNSDHPHSDSHKDQPDKQSAVQSCSAHKGAAEGRILDDSQHPLQPESIPRYAWPLLTKLKLAGE